jgi:hypothetical protein
MVPPDERDVDVEAAAASALGAQIGDHVRLCQRTFELISAVLKALPERRAVDTPLAWRVGVGLLIKISNDLRAVALLAARGYPVQAATVASSLYESAVTLAYIGRDDTLAKAWARHGTQDPLNSFKGVWSMTQAAVRGLNVPDADARAEALYRTYTQLCWAKHGNSAFLLNQSYTRVGPHVEGSNGPNTSEPAVNAATFALEHAVGLTFLAGAVFVPHHVPPEARPSLVAELRAIDMGLAQLRERSRARWGDEDPFPGQWRTVKKPKGQ